MKTREAAKPPKPAVPPKENGPGLLRGRHAGNKAWQAIEA